MRKSVVQDLVCRYNNPDIVQNRIPHNLLRPVINTILTAEYKDVIAWQITSKYSRLLLAQCDGRREEPHTLRNCEYRPGKQLEQFYTLDGRQTSSSARVRSTAPLAVN
jgi:hypothetical protein